MKRAMGLLLVLGLGGCMSLGGAPIGEAAELATMGRERPLREPMRPLRGGTRVLVIALDGVGHAPLAEALRAGGMPRTSALLGAPGSEPDLFAHAWSVPGVLSVLPSSTTAAWASVFTGDPPGRTGIPGNEWFVREEGAFFAPVPTGVRSRAHATRMLTDELLSDLVGVPTLYERADLRAHVSMNPVFRGADLLTLPNLGNLGDLVEQLAAGILGGGSTKRPGVYRETDEGATRSLIGALRDYGVPDIQVAYFPGVDLFTHQAADPERDQRRYLAETVDPSIGLILDAYAGAGVLERTYVVIVADHGHTPVLADDRHSLGGEGDDEPPALLERAGFRVRPLSIRADRDDFQAVLAYQGSMAFVYLADRSTCAAAGARCDWTRPPRREEDLIAAARAFHEASRSGARVPELEGTLDLVLARDPSAPADDPLPLRVYDRGGLVPVSEYLRRNPRPDLLRLEERLRDLATGPHGARSGDLVLLARSGAERPIEERFYFAAPVHSEHGSPHASDSRVPLIVAHPGRGGAALRESLRGLLGPAPSQLDVAPLVESLLAR